LGNYWVISGNFLGEITIIFFAIHMFVVGFVLVIVLFIA